MGHDRGEPGYSQRESERRDYVGRGKDNRHAREDEERNERPHKRYTLDKNTVCYGCGVKVHKHPECPEKVASIRRSGQSRCKVVQGRVGTDHANDTI